VPLGRKTTLCAPLASRMARCSAPVPSAWPGLEERLGADNFQGSLVPATYRRLQLRTPGTGQAGDTLQMSGELEDGSVPLPGAGGQGEPDRPFHRLPYLRRICPFGGPPLRHMQ
jgi:hypothetical protein